MDDLIKTLENFIAKKIAAEREEINDGYVSYCTRTHLDISRKELRTALEFCGLEIRKKGETK